MALDSPAGAVCTQRVPLAPVPGRGGPKRQRRLRPGTGRAGRAQQGRSYPGERLSSLSANCTEYKKGVNTLVRTFRSAHHRCSWVLDGGAMGADELLLAQSWLRSRRSITAAIEWRDTIVWFAMLKRMDGDIVGLLLSSRQCRSPPAVPVSKLQWSGLELRSQDGRPG